MNGTTKQKVVHYCVVVYPSSQDEFETFIDWFDSYGIAWSSTFIRKEQIDNYLLMGLTVQIVASAVSPFHASLFRLTFG
jgi:hypothetical protein